MKLLGKVVFAAITLLLAQCGNAAISIADFNINTDATYTNSANVTLYIHATDANKLKFSCNNSTWGSWLNYSSTAAFNIATGAGCSSADGLKTVYVTAWNTDSNTEAKSSDTITYDTTIDINSVWHDANSLDSNSLLGPGKTLTVRAVGEKDCNVTFAIGSTITDQNLFDDGAHDDGAAGDGTYANTYDVSAGAKSSNGVVYLTATFKDPAGNTVSKNSFTKLAVDVNDPVKASPSPANYTRDRTPAISVKVLDYASGVNANSIQMLLNGAAVASADLTISTTTNGYNVQHTPDSNIAVDNVDVNINVLDNVGNDANLHWDFIIDLNAPATISDLNAVSISDTNDINVSFSATTDAGSGVTTYYLYRNTSTLTNQSANTNKRIATITPQAFMTYTDSPGKALEGETLYYAVRALDGAGNLSSVSNIASVEVEDVTPPTDVNIYLAYYVNTSTPTINISANDLSSAKLSCNDTNYSEGFSSFPITSFNIKQGPWCPTTDGNRTLYLWLFDDVDNNVKVTRSILLDLTAPSAPSGLSTAINEEDKNIIVSWNASSDSGSGINHYYLYYKSGSGVTNLSPKLVARGLTYGYVYSTRGKYCFRARALDKAGNLSDLSEEICRGSDANVPVLSLTLSGGKDVNGTLYFTENGVVAIKASSNNALEDINGWVKQKDCNKFDLNFEGSGKEFTAEYTVIEGYDGNAKVFINALDELDLNASATAHFIADTIKPFIKSFDLNHAEPEILRITAEFNEDAKKAGFYYRSTREWKLLKEFSISKNNLAAIHDFNFSELTDLNLEIKVEAEDLAGNKRGKTSQIKLPKGILTELVETEKQRARAIEIEKELLEELIEPSKEFTAKQKEAAVLYEAAMKKYRAYDFNGSLQKISALMQVLEWLESNKPKITRGEKQGIDYEKEKITFADRLKEYLSGEALESSRELWNTLSFSRRIELIEVEDERGKKFQVLCTLVVKNSSGSALGGIKIVEIVPKALAQNAAEIRTNTIITVIREDPAVMFTIGKLGAGQTAEFKYANRELMSEEDARRLYSSIPGEFYLPIPVKSIEEAEQIVIPYRGISPVALALVAAFAVIAFILIKKRRLA